jgi:hypothetical protein
MEQGDKKDEKGSCCESSAGKCGCCPGKAALAIVLLLVGGLIGFAIGRGGLCHKMMPPCPMMGAPAGVPGK